MAFKDIIGNDRIKRILRKTLQKKKIPNSLLFSGPEGVGKKDMALVMAKAMNCRQKKDDACEECASCRAINRRNFPDVMELSPIRDVIRIDQMRILKQTAYFRPMVAKKRVFIVEDAEKMTDEASNSLLKILEEPPHFSHIILITQNPYMIIPTIKSRCQVLTFSRVSRENIEKVLTEKGYEEEKAKIISLLVRGNLKQAINLEWEEIQARRRQTWQFFLSLIKEENTSLFLKNFSSTRAVAKEELSKVLEILSSFCRDLILIKEKGDVHLLLNPDYEEEIKQTEKLLSLELSMNFLTKIEYALYALGKNLNINLLVSSIFSSLVEWRYA